MSSETNQQQPESKALDVETRLRNLELRIKQAAHVLVLIDGDGYIFQREFFWTGVEGGRRAAQELQKKVRTKLQDTGRIEDPLPVVVRVFASSDGLKQALTSNGEAIASAKVPEFIEGFNSVKFCEFVGVGKGKEAADEKLKVLMPRAVDDPTCSHLVFGACHDNGYVRTLEQFIEPEDQKRITLLYLGPTGQEYSKLPFKVFKLPSMFRDIRRRENAAAFMKPVIKANIGPVAKVKITDAGACEIKVGSVIIAPPTEDTPTVPVQDAGPEPSSWEAMLPQLLDFPVEWQVAAAETALPPDSPSAISTSTSTDNTDKTDSLPFSPTAAVFEPVSSPAKVAQEPDEVLPDPKAGRHAVTYQVGNAHQISNYMSCVLLNKYGQRVDQDLGSFSAMSSLGYLDKLGRGQNFCPNLYIGTICQDPACQFKHGGLDVEEARTLRAYKRTTPCKQGLQCRQLPCLNGHECEYGWKECQLRGSECAFPDEMHGVTRDGVTRYASCETHDGETKLVFYGSLQ